MKEKKKIEKQRKKYDLIQGQSSLRSLRECSVIHCYLHKIFFILNHTFPNYVRP